MRTIAETTLMALLLFVGVVGAAAIWQRIFDHERITLDRKDWRCTQWRQVEGLEARRCVTYRRIEAEPQKGMGT